MGETTIRWYSSVLICVTQVVGASMIPKSEIRVFSEDLDKRTIQRTAFLK